MQVKKQQLEPDMETKNWYKIGKGVWQGCLLSPCLFNFYGEYIMWHVRLMYHRLESRLPGEILRYADDTTLIAESKEELKSLLMRVKEESEKTGLKLSIQNT